MLPQLENLARVAAVLSGAAEEEQVPLGTEAALRTFSDLRREKFVFAGASILPLLLDEDFVRPVRGTDDTDVIVSVVAYHEWDRLRRTLKGVGICEDARDAIPVRFRYEGIPVDFIPARMAEFGTANRWLSLGFEMAEPDELENGQRLLRMPATLWLAAKIAAFESRGRRDVLMSQDLEDIVSLLLGRTRLREETRISPGEVRAHIVTAFRDWERDGLIASAFDGSVSTARDRVTLREIRASIAAL
jgi:hypothetical protein